MPIIGPKSTADSAIRAKCRASARVNPLPASAQPGPSPAPPDATSRGNPRVSAILPISGDADGLDRAFACLARQSLSDIEILLVPNGADPSVLATVGRLADADPRVRVIQREQAGLAAALNHALRDARAPLLARMDADDECAPDRLARQARFMDDNPAIAALGCAWEVVDAHGRVLYTVRPPQDPRRLRWKLLTGNQLAHGSMMLRRDAILDLGGYNEQCTKAQDYELWLRAAATLSVAALPDTLYRYHARATDGLATSHEQAAIAAHAMLDAWRQLPNRDEIGDSTADGQNDLTELIAQALLDDDQTAEALARLDLHLDKRGPSRESMLAHFWLASRQPPATRRAINACRLSRLREVGREIRADGVSSVWLFGAGSHTEWLLEHRAELGLAIAGLVDHALAGQARLGFEVRSPNALAPGQTVLISSDACEDQIWRASEPLRDIGVRVVRLYAD